MPSQSQLAALVSPSLAVAFGCNMVIAQEAYFRQHTYDKATVTWLVLDPRSESRWPPTAVNEPGVAATDA